MGPEEGQSTRDFNRGFRVMNADGKEMNFESPQQMFPKMKDLRPLASVL